MTKTKLKLKRICAGYYTTLDGKYELIGYTQEKTNDYRKAGEPFWMFRRVGESAWEVYCTKWEARQALEEHLGLH